MKRKGHKALLKRKVGTVFEVILQEKFMVITILPDQVKWFSVRLKGKDSLSTSSIIWISDLIILIAPAVPLKLEFKKVK